MESLEATMEKVELEGTEGFMQYGRIPYKIYFQTGSETCDLVDARNPASHMVTPHLLKLTWGPCYTFFLQEKKPKAQFGFWRTFRKLLYLASSFPLIYD